MLPPEHLYPADEWRIVEAHYSDEFVGLTGTVFSLGNGFVGIRGSFEEGRPALVPGTFINGFHETWPIMHAEGAHALARTGQTIVNVLSTTRSKQRARSRWSGPSMTTPARWSSGPMRYQVPRSGSPSTRPIRPPEAFRSRNSSIGAAGPWTARSGRGSTCSSRASALIWTGSGTEPTYGCRPGSIRCGSSRRSGGIFTRSHRHRGAPKGPEFRRKG
ncbi:MAG: hypothetical protein ACLPKI_32950 [Streptosporangiaceae bacterium]